MKLRYLFLLLLGATFVACTDLEEELQEDLTGEAATAFLNETADVQALLDAAYLTLRNPMQSQNRVFCMQVNTSDELINPTRGGDWDDGGDWRVLHNHTWGPDHSYLTDAFQELLGTVFTTTNILQFPGSPQQLAEARFLRAFAMWFVADAWGQVPFREAGTDLLADPQVFSSQEATDFIVSELNAIQNDLPDGPAYRANKDAAKVLLMKTYLNRATYSDRTSPSFPTADMDQVISIGNEIINSGAYALSDNVFDNFAPNNDAISTENIFTAENIGGSDAGNVRSRWFCTLHYNQNPGGWNGFSTLADFYDKFEDGDQRRGGDYTGLTDVSGLKSGFLLGQQFDVDGNALQDRKENPLSFTREVALVESGDNLEVTGIRVLKYIPDYAGGDNSDNDFVYYRLSDVMLMVAEAAWRNGDGATALDLVNQIRTKRGVAALTALDGDGLLDERARELYWEGHRRTDLIRFGKYLDAWQEKPASGTERLLFPIPTAQLAVNPNLKQNPGY